MKDATGHDIDAERPYLLSILACIGFFGCASLIIGVLVAQVMVPGHDWIADTVSDLGAGENEIIMDVALYGFAAGLMAISLASSHAHLGGIAWTGGVFCWAILAAIVVVVAARNEYGDGDNEGVVIHIYLVYGLGLFFTLAPLCMAAGIGRDTEWAKWALIGLGVLWGVASPIFFFLTDTIDGLYERVLGLIAAAQVVVLSWVYLRRGGEDHAQGAAN